MDAYYSLRTRDRIASATGGMERRKESQCPVAGHALEAVPRVPLNLTVHLRVVALGVAMNVTL